MMTFTDALQSEDLDAIRSFPKADLHNHFVLGGNREFMRCFFLFKHALQDT